MKTAVNFLGLLLDRQVNKQQTKTSEKEGEKRGNNFTKAAKFLSTESYKKNIFLTTKYEEKLPVALLPGPGQEWQRFATQKSNTVSSGACGTSRNFSPGSIIFWGGPKAFTLPSIHYTILHSPPPPQPLSTIRHYLPVAGTPETPFWPLFPLFCTYLHFNKCTFHFPFVFPLFPFCPLFSFQFPITVLFQ